MARGKRRRKPTKLDHLLYLAIAGAFGYVFLVPRYGLLPCVLLGCCILIFWVLFLMPTRCDFETKSQGSCHLPANGKARGCKRWHARDKRDALYNALRMRNPGMAVRVTWVDGARGGHRLGTPAPAPTPAEQRNHGQALFNLASIGVALVGSVAGVLALFIH